MKRLLLLTLVTVGVLFLFGYLNQGYREEKNSREQEEAELEQQKIERIDENNIYQKEIAQYIEDHYIVKDIEVFISMDNEVTIRGTFDEKPSEDALLEMTTDVIKTVKSKLDSLMVNVRWDTKSLDVYGNDSTTSVMMLDISGAEINKINFSNFDYNNLEKISDFYLYS